MKTKQQTIEDKIDSFAEVKTMGREMIAALGIHSRISINKHTATKFIRQFSASLGFKNHIDTAWRIARYLYPKNTAYWSTWDKIYSARINNSAWLKNQNHA